MTAGVAADYSPALNKLSFMRFEPSIKGGDNTGTYEIYVSNADGTNLSCLSCTDIPGGPRANQHKGAQQWHPTLPWMVGVVEFPSHLSAHTSVTPGAGLQNDLYAISADGSLWIKLSSYAPVTTNTAYPGPFVPWATPGGALVPRFNKTGTKVIWGEEIGFAPAPSPYLFGVQQIAVADFVIGANGLPSLQNKVTYTPGAHVLNGGSTVFYEPWSVNASNTLLTVASDAGTVNAAVLDIHLFDLATGQFVANLSPFPDQFQWEEQAQFSPDGTRIAFMTTADHTPPYSASQFTTTFRTDLWLMNPDGTGKTRLTRVNDSSRAEFLGTDRYAIPGTWKDDKSLYVEINRMTSAGQDRTASQIYLFTFP